MLVFKGAMKDVLALLWLLGVHTSQVSVGFGVCVFVCAYEGLFFKFAALVRDSGKVKCQPAVAFLS